MNDHWVAPRVCPDCGGHGCFVCDCVPRPEETGDVDAMVGDPKCPTCHGWGDKRCTRCDGAGALLMLMDEKDREDEDADEDKMGILVGQISARPPNFSWDCAQANGISFHGWQMDRLLYQLLEDCTAQFCDQCQCGGDCIHNAARTVLMMTQEPHLSEFKREWGMQQKITVIQPVEGPLEDPRGEYTVDRAVNILEPRIGDVVTHEDLKALIRKGVEVTIRGEGASDV